MFPEITRLIYKIVVSSVLISILIYSFILFIYSIYRYNKYKFRTYKLYEESIDRSDTFSVSPYHINGCVCNSLKVFNFEDFLMFIKSYVQEHGTIHMITYDKIFFNTLENHLLDNYTIVIAGTAIIPNSYIDFIYMVIYLTYCDTIEYHIDNDSKYSDSLESLFKLYTDSLLQLQELDDFKDINDIVAIKYSPEFGERKIIWKNPNTNILYMNGYENNPISILVAIMFYYKNMKSNNEISQGIADIVDKFTRTTKLTLCTFVEDETDNALETALNACNEGTTMVLDYLKSVEDNWMYNPFANSAWRNFKYGNKVINDFKENN